jgi:4-hydroxy-tetrahydrodipicolinate reductase
MGRRLIALMQDDSQCQLAGAVTHAAHAALGRDAGDVAGVGAVGIPLVSDLDGALVTSDVIIDFSAAAASLIYLQQAAAAGKPMVIGTTGFTPEQRQEIGRLSQLVPCLFAPNMSVGVQVMFQLVRQAAMLLGPDFDVEIIEAHHRTKIDAPSGTALRMGDIVAETRGQRLEDAAVHGRRGAMGRRSDTEIGIQAIRGGDIVGEHTVIFAGIGERIELIHRSQSRDNFVRGALRAAHWIVTQPPGLYGMEEMLQAL